MEFSIIPPNSDFDSSNHYCKFKLLKLTSIHSSRFLQRYRNTLPSDNPNYSPEKKSGELADNYVMAKKNTSFYK